MKRAYLATLTITLLTATSAYAVTCEKIPTCSELGYTDVVPEGNSDDYIKCPFNLTEGKRIGAGPVVGQIAYFPREITDPKWIKCDGRVLHKDAYPELYELLKYSFGGNGGNIFRVPDYSGDFIRVFGGDSSGTNTRQSECLPNITGTFTSDTFNSTDGAFYSNKTTDKLKDYATGSDGDGFIIHFDTSRSNSIYSSSCSHVTPVNTAVYAYIYAGKIDTSKGSAKDLIAGCATNSYYYTDGTCSTSLKSTVSLKGIVNTATSDYVYYFNAGGNSAYSFSAAVDRCRSMNAKGGVLHPSTAASYIGKKITSITGSVHPVSTSRTYWSSSNYAYSCSSATSCSTSVTPKAGTSYYFFCHGTDYFQ